MTTVSAKNRSDYTVFLPRDIPLEMVKVEGGTFSMGSEKNNREKPVHEVSVPDFYIGKYPVTVRQYLAFVKDTDSHHPEWMEEGNEYNIKTGSDNHYKKIGKALTHPGCPIVGVSWENAVAFCEWISSKYDAMEFRLPSEAEWEYAARGGKYNQGLQYAGSSKLKEVGWYNKNSNGQTQPVGLKQPNELGIYDMSGNVWEWCADHWHDNYEGAPVDGSAWVEGGDEYERVVRGGSWNHIDNYCRPSDRIRNGTDLRYDYIGFRLARYYPPER